MKRGLLSCGVTVLIFFVALIIVYPVWQRTTYNYYGPDSYCLSNLKQIGLAIFMYSDDYDGKLPPAVFPDKTIGWANGVQPYIKSFAIFHCPRIAYNERHSWPGAEIRGLLGLTPDHSQENPGRPGFTDYWMNGNISDMKLSDSGDIWQMTSPQERRKIEYQEQIILLGDGDGQSPQSTASYSINQLPSIWRTPPDSPAKRHLGGANYEFLDGHAKWLKPEQVSQVSPSKKHPVHTFLVR